MAKFTPGKKPAGPPAKSKKPFSSPMQGLQDAAPQPGPGPMTTGGLPGGDAADKVIQQVIALLQGPLDQGLKLEIAKQIVAMLGAGGGVSPADPAGGPMGPASPMSSMGM